MSTSTLIIWLFVGLIVLNVFKAVGQQLKQRKHVSKEELRAYLRNDEEMSDEDRSRINGHLGGCTACEHIMGEVIRES